ncbi:hypothetical protein B0J17DRAFT_100171 [Rhizoctonia solani]|nr:hypothetical protein B0J17DRAFT_100171 [Rhizoctonia solani]
MSFRSSSSVPNSLSAWSTISTFQKHILRRIELQARLVERVRLGRSTIVSTEIQNKLSLIWATIRNDEFDKGTFLNPSSPSLPPPDPPFDESGSQGSNRGKEKNSNRGEDVPRGSGAHTTFNSRVGTHIFPYPTQINGWMSLVNDWHMHVYDGRPVEYVKARVPGSPDHLPEWIVTPIILGELHPEYQATGNTINAAMNISARLIAASGHC